jgi:hypothetical protein
MESISRNIIAWRTFNKDFIDERHIPTAASSTPPRVVQLSAKDKWDRFYTDCISNVNNMMGDAGAVGDKKQSYVSRFAELLITSPGPGADGRCIRERMRIERMIMFRKLQLTELCRVIIEIRQVVLPQYRVDPRRYNEELGVKYLLGELTEQDFAVALQRADKKMQKSRDIQNIITMVLTTSTDIIFRFADHLRQIDANKRSYEKITENDFEILDEIRALFNYANKCMDVVARTYQSKNIVTLGQSLESKFWEDNGDVIYTKMTEYNRAIGLGGGGGAYANRNGNVVVYGHR